CKIMATFMERLAFLQKVPTLMKATADDETPCPGYLFQEIGKISHESLGCGQCLLEYLLERLQVESCHVKLKVLKIFVHLCGHGSNHFLTELRRNSTFIQQASVYSGPPDPIHGTALYQKVRNTAQSPDCLCVFTTAVAQRSPGQVGGGWEEMDSGNSSSHNSSQDIAANSRTSVGSKSAGTGSQSGASRESSGDLSERVEAMQLGDCGQEVALISKLTEGSRVFLSREESQHFIKECSILNCEVVVELLCSRLQEPSNTVQMRALCAVACLMTSDLLSLEQIFSATQRKLAQLSEGPPGPVANKATKILRQFEALVGGPLHAPRQDTAPNSQLLSTPTCSVPLLPSHSAHITKDLQSDPSARGATQPLCSTASLSGLDLTKRGSTGGLMKDEEEENISSSLEEESVIGKAESVRTSEAGDESVVEEPELLTDRGSPPPPEPQPCPGKLSLFSGMELVSRGRPLCPGPPTEREDIRSETDKIEETAKDSMENRAVDNPDSPADSIDAAHPACEDASDSSQPVSAFSFLNF
uniref:TEPSIN adaptor related protein complex 4 accessory protein n=1 Tax=Myripristis murdjan TaxID=586833 RepID=A0A668APJ7_9TELE